MEIKVGIHQPNFLPWLGYFVKMKQSDVFIFHDDVEYSKSSLTRRTYIRKDGRSDERIYLTVPLVKHKDNILIKDLRISDPDQWYGDAMNRIRHSYFRAPHFEEWKHQIAELLRASLKDDSFSSFSMSLTKALCDTLSIAPKMYQSSELMAHGSKTEYNIDLVKEVGGTTYLSGQGAKKYQDHEQFIQEGLKLRYLDPVRYFRDIQKEYPDFALGYSILDALFYLGTETVAGIINNYPNEFESIQ